MSRQNTASNSKKSKANELFERAYKLWKGGQSRSALRSFLAAAKAGDKGAQVNVGYFYDKGIGVAQNQSAALYWYKRAYRRGDSGAAHNIGTIWRDENQGERALSWFRKAVRLGNDSSNLEIAKLYLRNKQDSNKAVACLEKVIQSNRVAEVEIEEARRLLARIRKKTM